MDTDNFAPLQGVDKKVERSAAYPARTIEQSLEFTSEIYKNFRFSPAKRNDIISMLEGSHPRNIAACAYYQFLNREGDIYTVTELFKEISNPLNHTERQKNLLVAFEAPKLNKALIERFDGDELPKELVAHLTRFFGITQDAAPLAADVFIKNAKYCGVLSDTNVLTFAITKGRLNGVAIEGRNTQEEIPAAKESTEKNHDQIKAKESSEPQGKPPLLLEEMVNSEKTKVRLTGGKYALLVHPLDLNKTDVLILQKEIEKLQLIVESQ